MVHFDDGDVIFRIHKPHAERVNVVGAFTEWNDRAIPMSNDGDGWWSARLSIAPGEYEFHYLVDGHDWLADYAASGVRRNAFGVWVSLLNVPRVVVRSATPASPTATPTASARAA